MKKIIVLLCLIFTSALGWSQVNCVNFEFLVDYNHYTVDPATNDTTFVKYFQFDISDTSKVEKIGYNLFVVNSGTQTEVQNFDFDQASSSTDMTNHNSYRRVKKKMKVSFGPFKYQNKKYQVKIKLYDGNNNLLGTTDFNFDH